MGIPNQYNAQPVLEGLSIPEHDYIKMGYSGSPAKLTTVTYRYGGSSGTIVATLNLAYVGDNLDSVTRT